jgi:hypothetical protein
MKKVLIFAAVAALTLGACTKVDIVSNSEMDAPVGFSAYSGNTITKAGAYGEMNNTLLQESEANGGGFGVFAYKTTGDYPATNTTVAPNFMYNQKVLYNAGNWEYHPIKYWPNQIAAGNTDSQGTPAQGYAVDKVSFFAYAPYVAATASSGAVGSTDEGIIALSDYDDQSDPKVTYKVTNDLDKQVDLVWGVSHGATWTNVAGGTNTPTNGKPYLNLQKPAVGTAIHFYFHHALAQLKLQAIAAYNQEAAGGTAKDGVKITIDNVVITVPGMYQTAVLNLNNTAVEAGKPVPNWESETGSANLTLTVANANINPVMKDAGDVNASAQPAGVTYKAAPYTTPFDSVVDVINNGKYYTLIPKDDAAVTVNVKVTYYVTTDDANLNGGHSRVENVISHDVTFSDGFKAGTRNIIRMILGISEVKFEAEVVDWETGDSQDVNLPLNVE